MANELQVTTQLAFAKDSAVLSSSHRVTSDVTGSYYESKVLSISTTDESIAKGDMTTVGYVLLRNLDALNYVLVGDDGTNYPIKMLAGDNAVFRLNGDTIHMKTESVSQIETFTTVADVSDSLDGKYIQLSDDAGTVGFWIDTDDSGTTIPAGASALTRSVEVTTIVTDDTAASVATKMATAINADADYSASATDTVVTVTHAAANAGPMGDGVDGAQPTGFTSFTVVTNGEDPDVLVEISMVED